uniref:Small ribosomal subunit protein uS9c n=1 Tax=Euglena longa TaxID=3037 RepID=RR9_EUGLO|nr:ribosomal protein S9 [Euglena longa]P58135.1 RecName: Full=Small ribosomal subunit protein uS9c; AltName: Full=30S ribosomal protein S9, plastid [Euglena longa]CAC24583.1 ribosomal protein S9 [Euglena longa]
MIFKFFEAIGKRKCSIAKISLFSTVKYNCGVININGKHAYEYLQKNCNPFDFLKIKNYNVCIYVKGGGLIGQAEAIKLAISRALKSFLRKKKIKKLKDFGFLTRNSSCKERRKYGLKKARKAPQYSKR